MTTLLTLSETHMHWIEPYFSRSHEIPRVRDRHVLSGILFVIRNGVRWCDAPRYCGRTKTIFKSIIRWSQPVRSTEWPPLSNPASCIASISGRSRNVSSPKCSKNPLVVT